MKYAKIEWGVLKFKGNAATVYKEIQTLGEEAKPEQIVEYARQNVDSELHKCFTWDNTVAAEKYRLYEARQISRNLIVVRKEGNKPEPIRCRALMRTSTTSGYKPILKIMRNEDEYANLLAMAKAELHTFERKYQTLANSELREVFAAIRAV